MKLGLVVAVALATAALVIPRVEAQSSRVFTTGTAPELAVARTLALDHLTASAALRGIDGAQDLVVSRVTVDDMSMAHTRVQQYFNGVPVFGGEAIVHLRSDASLFAETDNLAANVTVDTTPRLTAGDAISNAVAEYGCSDCLTASPLADLWILRRDDGDHLVYRVQLRREDGTAETAMPVLFVDAHNGAVVWRYDNLQTGTGQSLYSGVVPLNTTFHGYPYNLYALENLTRRVGTFDRMNTTSSIYDLMDLNDVWDSGPQRAGVDVHWGTERTLEYLLNVHGRNGIDGAGGPRSILAFDLFTPVIGSVVHHGFNYANAFWNGAYMTYGDGDGFRFSPLVSLDVVAHEMTHGVTQFTAGLVYQGESGALNEAISDVFGAMAERYAKGESGNTWWIGEQIFTPNTPGDSMRYMDDPHRAMNSGYTADDDPDHYAERYTGGADNGGVHINSGIANKAFYLLARGGPHHLGGSMAGIGADQAAAIWYRALTSYMVSSTNFAGARAATINAANAIHGSTSRQAAAVAASWCMVGVGTCSAGTANSASPSSGNGTSQTFAFQFSHPDGAAHIASAWVWFTPTFSTSAGAFTNTCFIYYSGLTNTLGVLNNAGNGYATGTLGSGAVQNGQCAVNLAASSWVINGNTATLNLPMTFDAATFSGVKNIYLDALNFVGTGSGWPDRGDWTVGAPATVQALSVSPNTGGGSSQTFTLVYSDDQGAADITTAWVWFTPTWSTAPNAFTNTCFLYLHRATGTLNLLNDAANGYHSGTLGSSTTLENGQCSVTLSGSSASPSGNNLTVTLAMSFKAPFVGLKRIHMDAVSSSGTSSNWPDRGEWTVPAGASPAVAAVSVTPNTGTGTNEVFALEYSDNRGATNLATAWAWFTASNVSGAWVNSCFLYYQRATNTLNLLTDAGTAYESGVLGSSVMLENSQCAVALGSSTASTNGSTLTLHLNMVFMSDTFSGAKQVYIDAVSQDGITSGWPVRGDWTVPVGGPPPPPPVAAVLATPNSGSGNSQAFALVYSDSRGATNLATSWAWFSATNGDGAWVNSCFLYYQRSTNTLHLLNNAGTAYTSGTPGSSGTIQNGQCSVALAGTSAPVVGETLTLNLPMTFVSATFSGAKNIYMDAVSLDGQTSGWPDRGDWTVPTPTPSTVAVVSATPNSGSGFGQTFALEYSDSLGADNLATAWVWFGASNADGAWVNSCFLYYERATNSLRLLNDAGNGYVSGTLGSVGALMNNQCWAFTSGASVVGSGTTLTLNLRMSFMTAFPGTKNIYMFAARATGENSGWHARGTWNIPAITLTADSVTPSSGTGADQTFTFQATSTPDVADVTMLEMLFKAPGPLSTQSTCWVTYAPGFNEWTLRDDSGASIRVPLTSTATLSNSQCSVVLANSSVATEASTILRVTIRVMFSPSYLGTKELVMCAWRDVGAGTYNTNYRTRGAWTVPP